MHFRRERQSPHRLQQELAQLLGTLFVPPITDPDQIARFPLRRSWVEYSGIRRLVPHMHLSAPALTLVSILQGSAVRKHSIVFGKVKARQFLPRRDRAVMRVMEQQPHFRMLSSMLA